MATIDFRGHILQEEEIIGIGPVVRVNADGLPVRVRLCFDLYCKALMIRIQSDNYDLWSEEEKRTAKKHFDSFFEDYEDLLKRVKVAIAERWTGPNDSFYK